LQLANTLLLAGHRFSNPRLTQLLGLVLLNPTPYRRVAQFQVHTNRVHTLPLVNNHPADFKLERWLELSVLLGHGDSSIDVFSHIEVSGGIRPAQNAWPCTESRFASWALFRGGASLSTHALYDAT